MVALRQPARDQRMRCRHAGGEAQSLFPAFECGKFLLELPNRRVGYPRIGEAFIAHAVARRKSRHFGRRECRRHDEIGRGGAGNGIDAFSRMNGNRPNALVLVSHRSFLHRVLSAIAARRAVSSLSGWAKGASTV